MAVVSSLLYILAFPNFNLSWLAFVALVPLVVSVSRSSPRRAFLHGWLAGTLAYVGILYWIVVTFHAAHLSWSLGLLSLLLLASYLGLYWGAWSWFLSLIANGGITRKAGKPERQREESALRMMGSTHRSSGFPASLATPALLALTGACAWVALEYLRTYLFSGFPWALLADSQVKALPLIQIASVTGVYGVSFLIVLVNLTVAEFLLFRHSRVRGNPENSPALDPRFRWDDDCMAIVMTASLLLVCLLFGSYRLHRPLAHSPSPPMRVALLQGNIDQYKKWDAAYVQEIETTYQGLVQAASQAEPNLIVWPETSVPGYLLQEASLWNWLQPVVRNSRTNQLVGAPYMSDKNIYNMAFSLDRQCHIEGEYAKQHLVPFGEVVPWANSLGRFIPVLNSLGGFAAGGRSPVVPAAGVPVGVNICYEAIFPNLVRRSVKQGAQVIANLTNDGWYMRTAAPYQHWAPNIFRAVENGRWVLRADNTGISGLIDPTGHVAAASRIFEASVLVGDAQPRTELTIYTRFGDLFAWACALFCVGILARAILRV
jgi:apolipoprotein N-acyltransferase